LWYGVWSSDVCSSDLNDVPVPGDYDGDGITDIAVWQPQTGIWHIIRSSDGMQVNIQWGDLKDIPISF
jgi:hypothetical protein